MSHAMLVSTENLRNGHLASPIASMPGTPLAVADGSVRWSWACRILREAEGYSLDASTAKAPVPGDLAMVQVDSIGEHERLMTRDNKRLRVYPGDRIVGVFGSRYATDAYEAEIRGCRDLSLLTGGGMIGTIVSKHARIAKSTTVSFLGFLADRSGARINLKNLCFHPPERSSVTVWPLIAVVGTAMNSGKTTSSVKLIKCLSRRGLRVGACKLTGSVSNRDQDEMRSAAPGAVIDFSDYGFPSTYLCSRRELLTLFQTMLADLDAIRPEVAVMEIADGILQRETAMLLEDPAIAKRLSGVVLSADSAMAALYALDRMQSLGHKVMAVTGSITSSPLAVREFQRYSEVPVAHSTGTGEELGDAACRQLQLTV